LSRFLGYLWRFAVILVGFIVGVSAASLFFNLLAMGAAGWAETAPFMASGPIYFTVFLLATYFGYHAFTPALFVILATEFLGRRDWLTQALGGAVAAGLGTVLAWRQDGGERADAGLLAVLVAAGIVGGFAYWLVAGRQAGVWLHGPDEANARERSGS